MSPVLLLHILRRQPFRPFHVYLSSGVVHQIPHPELAAVGTNILVLRFPATLHPIPVGGRETIIVLAHIVQIETIQPLKPTLN